MTITTRILAIVKDETDWMGRRGIEPTLDSTLAELGVRQHNRIRVAVTIEEEWCVDISDEEMEGWDFVSDIVASVERLVGEK